MVEVWRFSNGPYVWTVAGSTSIQANLSGPLPRAIFFAALHSQELGIITASCNDAQCSPFSLESRWNHDE